jgi:hypothetical protein
LIDANVSGLALVVDPSDAGDLVNFGLMRARDGGILRLTGSGSGIFDNGGGTIMALDGSQVQLTAGAFVTGGTLSTMGSGTIRNIGTATLDNLTNTGTFLGNNGSSTLFSGTITNTGSITLASTGSFTDLFINSGVTLTGGSVLNLQNAARVRGLGTLFIGGSDGGAYTVQGETNNSGSLGTNELGIVIRSGGLIDANVSGLALVVDPGDAGDLFNFGVMRASAGGILRLTGSGNGIFDNGSGTIAALDGSEVQLTAGAFITGGTLITVGTGTIRNIGSATLDSVTNSGNFIANNGSTTTFSGNITNTGNLLLGSTGSFTDLFINSNVTLLGGSTLTLQNAARVRGIGTLFNGGPGGEPFTIQGETNNSGSLGTNELAIVNRSGGIINANVTGLQLIVDPRATDGLINNGVMQASNGGILTLTGVGEAGSTTLAASSARSMVRKFA